MANTLTGSSGSLSSNAIVTCTGEPREPECKVYLMTSLNEFKIGDEMRFNDGCYTVSLAVPQNVYGFKFKFVCRSADGQKFWWEKGPDVWFHIAGPQPHHLRGWEDREVPWTFDRASDEARSERADRPIPTDNNDIVARRRHLLEFLKPEEVIEFLLTHQVSRDKFVDFFLDHQVFRDKIEKIIDAKVSESVDIISKKIDAIEATPAVQLEQKEAVDNLEKAIEISMAELEKKLEDLQTKFQSHMSDSGIGEVKLFEGKLAEQKNLLEQLTKRVDRFLSSNRYCKENMEDLEGRMKKLEAWQSSTKDLALMTTETPHSVVPTPTAALVPADPSASTGGTGEAPSPSEQPPGAAKVGATATPTSPPTVASEAAGKAALEDKDGDAADHAESSSSASSHAMPIKQAEAATRRRGGTVAPGGGACQQHHPVFEHPEDPVVRAITLDIEEELIQNIGLTSPEKDTFLRKLFLKVHPDKTGNSQAMLWYNNWRQEYEPWYLSNRKSPFGPARG